MKRCAALLLGLSAMLPAFADVIYQWHTVTPSAELPGFSATLRITDQAFHRGSAFIDYDNCGDPHCAPFDNDGILYIGFSFALGSDGHGLPNPSSRYDRLNLTFDKQGHVGGSVSYNSTHVELMMSGADLWTVDLVRGDPYIGTPCGGPGFCSGTTGYFLAESLPVPEPGGALLMLAGLGALAVAGRKTRA